MNFTVRLKLLPSEAVYLGVPQISGCPQIQGVPDETHRRLKTLAAYCGMTMKDFLLSRALAPGEMAGGEDPIRRADDLLFSETTTFKLSPDEWDAFRQALEGPAAPTAGLRSLMTSRSVLDGR
jgi:uncharacterized protein (DUF1778 family)